MISFLKNSATGDKGIDFCPKAIANYPESKFLDPFLSEIHEPERIKELAELKERKVAAAIALEAARDMQNPY